MNNPEDKLLETWKSIYSPSLNANCPPHILNGIITVALSLIRSPYKQKLLADNQFSEDMSRLTHLVSKAILVADDIKTQLTLTKKLISLERYLCDYETLKRFEFRTTTRDSIRARIREFPELADLLGENFDIGDGEDQIPTTHRNGHRRRNMRNNADN